MAEKSIAKNAVFNVLYRFLNMLFPFITSVYVSHIILARGIGKVGTAQNVVQYFVLLAPLGIVNYGTREISKVRNEKTMTRKVFSELFFINATSTIFFSVIYYYMVFSYEWFAAERLLFAVSGLPIIFNIINVEWYYQGHEEYVYIAIRSVIIKFLSLILMLLLVKNAHDYVIYAAIYVLGIAGNYCFNAFNLYRKGIRLQFTNLSFIPHFKPILILLFSNIAIELYTLLDTTMLSANCSEEIVGYYTNSIKLVKIIVVLITAIGSILLPRLSYYMQMNLKNECNRLLSTIAGIMLYFAMPCGVGVFILADKVVYVMFGASFIPAVSTVRIATGLIYVLGFSNLFGTQVLLTFNQEKKLLLCTSIGALSNILMNYFLIPVYQQNGATIASVCSETLVTIISFVFAMNYVKLSIQILDLIKMLFATFFMGLVVISVSVCIPNILLSLLLSVTIGIIVYLFIGKAIKITPAENLNLFILRR